jgi:hypothetical protein
MRPLEIVSVYVDHIPGRPSTACVELSGGLQLDQIQVWPARHGPLVLFPIGNPGHTLLELTPLVRSMVVRSVVASWRQSLSARAAA